MFYASAHPVLRRDVYAPASRSLQRFLNDTLLASNQATPQYQQDEATFQLTLDLPGVARDQLAISIEGAVVRIQTREGASRRYQSTFELPQEIDPALSEARLEHGVLTLKLGKKVPLSKAVELNVL